MLTIYKPKMKSNTMTLHLDRRLIDRKSRYLQPDAKVCVEIASKFAASMGVVLKVGNKRHHDYLVQLARKR
jgi:hypothetical protein